MLVKNNNNNNINQKLGHQSPDFFIINTLRRTFENEIKILLPNQYSGTQFMNTFFA